MLELDDVAALIALFKHGSVQATARELGVSRATVRRRVDALEAAVGAPLSMRSKDGLTPTATGALLVEEGRQLLEHAQRLTESARNVEGVPTGTLTVALPTGLPRQLMAVMHRTMMSMWPDLDLVVETHADPVAQLPKRADLALTLLTASLPPRLDAVPMRELPLRLMASSAYLSRHGPVTSRSQLAERELLVWSTGVVDPNYLPLRDGSHLRIAPRLVSNDAEMLRIMAGNGAGLAFVPDIAMPSATAATANLVPVLPDVIGTERTFAVVMLQSMRMVPKVRVLLELTARLSAQMSGAALLPQ